MENGSGGANGNYTANTCGNIIREKGTIGTHFSIVVTSGAREGEAYVGFKNIGNILFCHLSWVVSSQVLILFLFNNAYVLFMFICIHLYKVSMLGTR